MYMLKQSYFKQIVKLICHILAICRISLKMLETFSFYINESLSLTQSMRITQVIQRQDD